MDHAGSTTSRNFNQILDTSSCSDCETSAMTWSYCPTLQGRVLSVVMHQVKHPVPIDVLNHLFSVYGVVETIFQSLNQHGRKVLIQYQHDYMADNALRATHGWYLYSTYCQLDVRHAYPAELQILYDYSCAFLAEINTSEQKLTHEVAMPKVEAIDDLCSVIPHLKGKISEQQPQVIQQLLAQIQANLAAIIENLSQDLKHMKQNGERTWDCSQQTAASQPNPPTQEVIKVFDETPTYDVYDDEVSDCSNGSINVLDVNLEQQQCENGDAMPELEKSQDGDKLSRAKPDDEILVMCSSKALETASLEVATEFACSDVFDNILEQQPYEEKHQEGDRLLKCSSKALETEHTGACLNIISDVRKFALERQQQDDEKACNCPLLKASDSVVTSSSKLSSAQVLRGLRWLWDPGTSASLHSSKGNFCWYQDVQFNGIALWLITFNPP